MTGSGTVGDPYIIYDVNDLQDIELDLAAYYELEIETSFCTQVPNKAKEVLVY